MLALTEPHPWHLAELAGLEGELITATRHQVVDLSSPGQREDATAWWSELTEAGGEGMVVKPAHLTDGRVQPGLKVRGREYLRIIYGPDYLDSLRCTRKSLPFSRSSPSPSTPCSDEALAGCRGPRSSPGLRARAALVPSGPSMI